jgi:hypothetical protein
MKLGNNLTCFTPREAARWESANGTLVAQTDIIEDSKRYVLFLGHFGLRLVYTTSFSSLDLEDFKNCIWITPIYEFWWYIYGSTVQYNQYSVCNDTSTNAPFFPMPTLANTCLNNCGTFRKPIGLANDFQLVAFFSKNKRFVFQMMNSGKCTLMDMNSGTLLFSTDDYISSTSCPKKITYVQSQCSLTPQHLIDLSFCPTVIAESSAPSSASGFSSLYQACTNHTFTITFTANTGFQPYSQCSAFYNDTNSFMAEVLSCTSVSPFLLTLKIITTSCNNAGNGTKWIFRGLKVPTTGVYS